MRRRGLGWLGGLLALTLSACGDDNSTGIGSAPTTLVAISPTTDTVVTGELADPPVSVRVEDASGSPVEGIPVRFFLASGDGSVFPNVGVSGNDGIAEASYRAALSPGEARVRADIPSATSVSALEFILVTEASDSVTLTAVEGDGQRAEAGSQLAIPFTVEAKTPAGNPAGGIAIAWRVASGDPAARLTADTTETGDDGRSQVLLTLGSRLGEYAVEAVAIRGIASDTARFTAEAAALSDFAIQLDSVSPAVLVAGQPASLHGTGFSILPGGGNQVRIEGEPAQVEGSSQQRIDIIVPDFDDRCLPAREVGVRVLVAGEPSNGLMVRLRPSEETIELAVGQVRTLSGPEAISCLQFEMADEGREYELAVGSASRSAASRTSIRLVSRSGEDPRAPAAAVRLRDPDLAPSVDLAAQERLTQELLLRSNVRRELERRRAVPARPRSADTTALAAVRAPPSVGDTLRYTFAVQSDFTASCADTSRAVDGIVREIRDNLILVEDTAAPDGGLPADRWAALADELDQIAFPTDTAYFGAPADIDGNGRVILLFTPEVNRLTSPGSTTGIGGFFLPLDLAASGAGGGGLPGPGGELCPASNEAELIYVVVPDPDGLFGDPVNLAQAERNARSIPAHELQHLINAQGRVLGGDGGFEALEETWLDEGLSHLAEEVVGLRVVELGPGSGLTWSQVTATRDALDAFNAFHINNYFQLSLYMFSPNSAPVLAVTDPGGLLGLQMRGFSWFFLRWLADQEGGADERALFRAMVAGGQNRERGIDNVEQATGVLWDELVADFGASLPVDASAVPELAQRYRVLTWDHRDVFANLNQNPSSGNVFPIPYPLAVTSLRFETAAIDFDVQASTVKYFSLGSGFATPSLALSLRGQSGELLTEASVPQLTVVRTR